MKTDTRTLRKMAVCIFLADNDGGHNEISAALKQAADDIDALPVSAIRAVVAVAVNVARPTMTEDQREALDAYVSDLAGYLPVVSL